MPNNNYEYTRIPDADYKKLHFKLRTQIDLALNGLMVYGLDPHVRQAAATCVTIAENFAMATRGKKKSIEVLSKPVQRVTEDEW